LGSRAIFLDRDGTLNVRPAEHEYLRDVADFAWLPGSVEAVARLSKAGFVVAVVSNQRGVARGLVTEETLRRVELRMQRSLSAAGGRIDAFRYCVHDVADGCDCRKPKPRMLLDLARELRLDLEGSWMIGDTEEDVLAGEAAGCRTVLLGSAPRTSSPTLLARDLAEASRLIVG
jgi:D-glycero-D-manno-heptose 1,7-bisphosphate phosphatase